MNSLFDDVYVTCRMLRAIFLVGMAIGAVLVPAVVFVRELCAAKARKESLVP
jgi:hypothetical protein